MSKEKQIEGMAEILRKVCEPSLLDECDSKSCNECMAEAIYNAGYRRQSEWISVEERLPDNGETVLTVDNEGYMIVASWYELGGWFLPVCRANPVTHWMPLPEPPVMKGV